jgi:hypothetical protein
VELERVEPGEDGTGSGDEQRCPAAICPRDRAVVELHDAGREPAPRPTRPASVRDGAAGEPELHEAVDADDRGTGQRDGELVRTQG